MLTRRLGTKEMDNRRKSLRIPVVAIASVIQEDKQSTAKILIRDLSTTGLGGYINCPCQRGDRFLVNLKLNTSDNEVVEDQLSGEICWSTEIDKGEKYAFGLVFRGMELKNTPLHHYLKTLERNYLQELEEIYQLPQSS